MPEGLAQMPRRPSEFTQADIARALRAAKQAGAREVVIRHKNGAELIIRIRQSPIGDVPLVPAEEIVL
jgi:hypothetical protein